MTQKMLITKTPSNLFCRHITFQTTTQLNPDHLAEKLVILLKQCISIKSVQQIHTQMLIHSIYKPNFLLSKIIDLKHFSYASLFVSQMPQPNDYSFNIMIRGLTNTWQKFDLALKFYYRMKFLGLKPDFYTYPSFFVSCANVLALDQGRLGHSMVLRSGLFVDGHVRHSLITMYSRCGDLGSARKVFDEIADRDKVSWNSMISGYSKMGFARDAVEMFGKMKDDGFQPDEMTIVSVLAACGDLGDLSLGRGIEEFVVDNKMELNSYVGSALIDMFGKCGDLQSARRIFDAMEKKDRVAWNAMLTGYAQNGSADDALSLFNSMKEAGAIPDKITLVVVLSACASIGALDYGKWIDSYASQRGLQHNIYVATALLDMYAKCGSVDHAFRVFENMPQKNEVSWNAMISALAFHGQAQEALMLFDRMLCEGGTASPNDITFIGVLSACVHAGLVDKGRQLFDLMRSEFGLVPKIEHYSCMVDLLSRAGLIYEAWDFIQNMPGKPDEVMLGSLLGACQKRGNVDVGEQVMQLLLQMEPSNSGNYIISSKIFANSKMWDNSARMRVLMRQKGVTKVPGCSWIEMDAQVHEFHSADSLHPNSHGIYEILDIFYEEIKIDAAEC